MAQLPKFRPATRADAAALAVLVDIAGEGLPAYLWSTLQRAGPVDPRGGPRARRAARRAASPIATPSSPSSTARLPAALVGYRLDDPYELGDLDALPELVRPLVELEALAPGSWYVNVLATFPEFRRRGIARKLLDLAETKAAEAGAPSLSVIVAAENDRAMRLYASADYGPLATSPVFMFPGCPHGGNWVLMVKRLQAGG